MEDLAKEVEQVIKETQEKKIAQAKYDQTLEQLKAEREEIVTDLDADGLTPETLRTRISELESSIKERLAQCKTQN
jgi:hypothetical protein